jgi:hypothetical protein
MKFIAVIFLLAASNTLYAQTKQKETKLDCVAHWKKGEERTYLLTRNKSKIVSGNPVKSEDFLLDIKVSVLDSSAKGYTINWEYAVPREIENDPLKSGAASLIAGMKFLYKTDEAGSFTELVNWEEVRDFYAGMLKAQFQGRNDSVLQKIMDQTLAMFQTREKVESVMIREIQFFHGPYGITFSTKDTSIQSQIMVPVTNTLMPALHHWRISEAAADGENFKLVITQQLDSVGALKVIQEFFKNFDQSGKKEKEDVRKQLSSFKIDDYSEYQYVRSTGWLQAYYITRKVSTGEGGQMETYKMELRVDLP